MQISGKIWFHLAQWFLEPRLTAEPNVKTNSLNDPLGRVSIKCELNYAPYYGNKHK